MGKWFVWFQKDNVAELKKDREKLLAKRESLDEEIEAINERIATLESENEDNN